MKISSRTFKLLFNLLPFIIITSCGGGGSDALPERDTTAPLVIGTSPASGTIKSIDTDLVVTFDESIQKPKASNISIFPYRQDGSPDEFNTLTVNANPLFDDVTKELTIVPNGLMPSTKYHVYVHGLKDQEGNTMADCRWEFAIGYYDKPITTSNNLCDTKKPDLQPGSFEFSTVTSSVSELGGSVTLTVKRVGGSNGSVSVDYKMVAGSATAGTNYVAASGTLPFFDNVVEQQITVSILRDVRLDQPDISFSVELSNATDGAVIGQNNSHSINIRESDFTKNLSGTFSFELPTDIVVKENLLGSSFNIKVIRSKGLSNTVTIDYSATDLGTNTGGTVDYRLPATKQLIFAPNDTSKLILVEIVNDTLIETLEKFKITLSNIKTTPSVAATDALIDTVNNSYTITIDSSEDVLKPGILSFKKPSSTILEDAGKIDIVVSRNNGVDGAVSVKYKTVAGLGATGAAGPNDYTAITTATLNFAAGINTGTISVLITPDFLTEGSEDFFVELFATSNGVTLSKGIKPHPITITDVVTPGTVEFSSNVASFSEVAGNANLTLNRTGGANGPLTITYTTADGTALAPADYTAVTNTITFAEGESSKTISIPLINDNLADGNKTFTVTLTAAPDVLGATQINTVTIVDVGVSRPLTTAELVAIWSLLL